MKPHCNESSTYTDLFLSNTSFSGFPNLAVLALSPCGKVLTKAELEIDRDGILT
jgi:hypothetical protein